MEVAPERLWQQCKKALADRIPTQPYNTWIRPVELLEFSESADSPTLTLSVRDNFHKDWIDRHYGHLLKEAIEEISGDKAGVKYQIVKSKVTKQEPDLFSQLPESSSESTAPDEHKAAPSQERFGSKPSRSNVNGNSPLTVRRETVSSPIPRTLNPRYTFDSFIEADCNRLARSAGIAVANRPGETSFNPYLIYGKVGLGKTHLAHAIGNYIVENNPSLRVLYMTSEAFTNFFVHAIKQNTLTEFTQTFRLIDVLIVDDIQFFGGKEKTQEQFFHLFNDLHQRGKQIILCADRSPAEIAGIEERLLSRFRWGLSADVQPPDLETRIAILHNHAQRYGLMLSEDVIDFIAYNVKDNIRILEGAINRLLAIKQISKNRPIDLAFVQEALHEIIDTRMRKTVSADGIRDIVAESFDLDPDLLIGKSRKRPIVDARQVAMFFCKQLTQLSLEAIGRRFGGRDHSTVIHACRAVQARIDTDPGFQVQVELIGQRLQTRVPSV
ncbi:MAG: chromosomal replication initiator protein DnaA [Bacteroidetes bacterium]|nr:chromosomal replication initiator protein DnaA [Bacteroidota bacterium]